MIVKKKAVSYLFELKLIAVPVPVLVVPALEWSEGWFFFEINEVNDLFFLSYSVRLDILDCDH